MGHKNYRGHTHSKGHEINKARPQYKNGPRKYRGPIAHGGHETNKARPHTKMGRENIRGPIAHRGHKKKKQGHMRSRATKIFVAHTIHMRVEKYISSPFLWASTFKRRTRDENHFAAQLIGVEFCTLGDESAPRPISVFL